MQKNFSGLEPFYSEVFAYYFISQCIYKAFSIPLCVVYNESSAIAGNAGTNVLSAEFVWIKGLNSSYFLGMVLITKGKIETLNPEGFWKFTR